MYIVTYAEIQKVLSTAVGQLRRGDSEEALKTLETFMQEKPLGDLAIRGIIGRQDVKQMVPPSLMVNSCSNIRLEEFAERMDNTALEMDELALETFDRIYSPSDFMKEYPRKELVSMDDGLETLVQEWMERLPSNEDGRITEDFLYWQKGTPLKEVEDGVQSLF